MRTIFGGAFGAGLGLLRDQDRVVRLLQAVVRNVLVLAHNVIVIVAVWAAVSVPSVRPQPRERQTLVDTIRRFSESSFVTPTLALAATTAALSVGVGFLPVLGTQAGLSPAAIDALLQTDAARQAEVVGATPAKRATVGRGRARNLIAARDVDDAGEPVSVAFPFRQAASVMMTMPRLLSKALKEQTQSDTSRYVFMLGRWSIESTEQPCLIMTLTTDDGFEVSFGIPFETCRAMGWALKEEGAKATAVPPELN